MLNLLFEAAAPVLWPVEIRRGIQIVDPFAETRAAFVNAMDEALAVIEQNDRMRFARLKREIKLIINTPLLTGAAYSRRLKVCRIDLRCFPLTTPDRESCITLLACVLVHETTHGHLSSKRIAQTTRIYSRVEALCWKEEVRFAAKLGLDISPWGLGKAAQPPSYRKSFKIVFEELKEQMRRFLHP